MDRTLYVSIPLGWKQYIDKARGDMSLDEWVCMVVRDALIDAGKWPGGKLEIKIEVEKKKEPSVSLIED